MKKFTLLTLSLTALLSISSCGKPAKQKIETLLNANEMTEMVWHGTYQGVSPAADCPGVYWMVAIDSNGFQCLNKYIDRAGIYLYNGKVKWKPSGDSIVLEGYQMAFEVKPGKLQYNMIVLQKISNETTLPDILTTTLLKDNKSGKNAELKEYTENNKRIAKFNFDGKHYNMSFDKNKNRSNIYFEGKDTLTVNMFASSKPPYTDVVLRNDSATYQFTLLSPVNQQYVATDTAAISRAFDVLYLNNDSVHEVLLINPEYKLCMMLPQVEAAAKQATYLNGSQMWIANGDKGTLSIGDHRWHYKSVKMEE